MNLQPYEDFVNYIIDKTYKDDKYHILANELKREIKYVTKEKRNLSWFWLNTAKELFEIFNIKDERISVDMIKKEVSFTHRRKRYNVKIFLDAEWQKYGDKARLVLNSSGMDDEKFIIETIKRYIDKGIEIDPTRAFLYYNYLILFLKVE